MQSGVIEFVTRYFRTYRRNVDINAKVFNLFRFATANFAQK